jgi:VanZ family protein
LLLMAILYWLSSLPGIPLSEDDMYYDLFRWVAPSIQNALHVPAYAALTLAWRWALGAWMRSPVSCVLGASAIASVCGVLDEWHQSFVPGRFASATDVVLDIAGVALGIWLAAWIGSRAGTFKPQVSAQEGDSDI